MDSHIPMANGETITVMVEAGEPEFGLWCDDCQFSTVARFPLTALFNTGVCPVGSVMICDRCGIVP